MEHRKQIKDFGTMDLSRDFNEEGDIIVEDDSPIKQYELG